MDGRLELSRSLERDRVTRLVGTLVDPESPSAESQHLRHERKRIQATSLIKSREDLILAANFDKVSYPQAQRSALPPLLRSGAPRPGIPNFS